MLFFELNGLEELRLGGVVLGGTGAVIREFSTDPHLRQIAIILYPTQKQPANMYNSKS